MVRLLRHRQTKGAVTDRPNLRPPRHILTLLRFQSVDATPLISSDREEDVANEISDEDLLHGSTEDLDVGPLAKRRVPELDRAAL